MNQKKLYKKYFNAFPPLQIKGLENPRRVTVEPGIYLPDEGFGVRIEDDVVIQVGGGPLNLMQDIPIEIDNEELMNN